MKTPRLNNLVLVMALTSTCLHAGVETVDGPDISKTNSNYVSNRAPLVPSRFIGLPVGSVQPHGWLLEFLKRQRDGLTGNLGEISAWLQKDGNAWLSKDGKGKYGWEELPYWLKGYIELGYIFNDPKMIAESNVWIEGALASQRPNGDFGPDQHFEDGTRDYWANMIMLFCLQSYYEHTEDPRVLELMKNYFAYQLTVPDKDMLTHYWQNRRGGDNLQAIYWLYNRIGDKSLLKLAEKIHRCTANWEMKGDLPDWHNVNIAEAFREPAQYYLQTGNKSDLLATYADFAEVRKRYGQVPGGMFGGDENCRPGYGDPRQAIETCGMVEQMLSDEMLLQITGDPFWADHCEDVAFNSYPAAVMPDFRSLRYLTAPNMVVSDSENHAPGIGNRGPFLTMNPFSSRCCQHNHSHGWPYFSKHLWMATPDNGLLAAIYSASEVTANVAGGAKISISEDSHYPFEDTIRFAIHAEKDVAFPLYLRVPEWCAKPEIKINGKAEDIAAKGKNYVKIDRGWKDGDTVTLKLPMKVSVKTWKQNEDSVSVNYGPLTFSLKIGERFDKHDSTKTAIGDSSWQPGADPSKWPSFEIHPTTPWNYGLVLNQKDPAESFTVSHGPWPESDFPFTPDAAPLTMKVKAKRIPGWTLDQFGLCSVLQQSPVKSDQAVETVTLVPMGATRLRISAFPTIGDGPDAHQWQVPPAAKKPEFHPTASHVMDADSADAVNDGLSPANSADESIPRFTWWDHKGTTEWVQYEFPAPRKISAADVYWFDDTGKGQCRLPESWRLLYRNNGSWEPVPGAEPGAPAMDGWNVVKFPAITVDALRIEAKLQPNFSAGILEWKVD